MRGKKRLFGDVSTSVKDQGCSDTAVEERVFKKSDKLLARFSELNLAQEDFQKFKKGVIWFAQMEGLNAEFLNQLRTSEKERGFLFLARTYLERLGCKNLLVLKNIDDSILIFNSSIQDFLAKKYPQTELGL